MMIFPDRKKAIHAILGPHGSNAGVKDGEGPEGPDQMLHALAEELIAAVHEKDAAGVKSALQSFFGQCDAEPHEEGEHLEE